MWRTYLGSYLPFWHSLDNWYGISFPSEYRNEFQVQTFIFWLCHPVTSQQRSKILDIDWFDSMCVCGFVWQHYFRYFKWNHWFEIQFEYAEHTMLNLQKLKFNEANVIFLALHFNTQKRNSSCFNEIVVKYFQTTVVFSRFFKNLEMYL